MLKKDKWIRKILSLLGRRPQVYLYALCWNDEKMLPYFFKHYNKIVDKYFIFDNGSTDKSIELLKANKKVILGKFEVKGNSFVQEATDFYNDIWKNSYGKADWVIICNIDEFFYHPEGFKKYLKKCYKEQYSIIQPIGYEMISDLFPNDTSKQLYEQIRHGFRSTAMDKPQIFNPDKIKAINFRPGRHTADPIGVITTAQNECKLLHFKYIGMEYWLPRQNELKTGLRELDLQNKWGVQYIWEDEEKIQIFNEYKKNAAIVI
jgi:hypothetical protein